ncbi:DUF2784 domain-containing protein [Acrocarpospora macrocephala]|uniref:DUF2784 domain-containing protein n=2 Tax=Acrocarpospora macrocephala TaxID=150177 RepID=A0A5M3X4I3_9ACTN|nr:hypothetical protein Amac_091430 [Acrocarpospora macrocephala]
MYRAVWEVTMVVHFIAIGYIALGGFLAWRWPRLIWPHLAFAGWGLIQLTGLVECPLTALENWGRHHAGASGLKPGGFIDTYIEGVVYPAQYVWLVRWVVIAAILISWAGVALRHRRAQRGMSHTSTA